MPWRVVYAQVENALSAQPTVYLDIASKQGGGVIHKGQICLRGLGCPSGTRELAEYSSLTVDNSGFPNMIYEATVFPGKNEGATSAICFFTKGTQRPLTPSETLTEIDCGSGAVSSSGGWHSVADDRATDGAYCRNVGANKTNSKAYLQFSYTGNKVDLRMASGPRGGNAEVLIDGASKGKVDFYRAASDPVHPDNSGKNDLTFGEFASFPTSSGNHVFRLNVLNDAGGTGRDIIYVDGFVVHQGGGTGNGNPTESGVTLTGVAPAGVLGTPGLSLQHVSTTSQTQILSAIFEVADDAHPQLKILDTFGATLKSLTATLPTGSLRATPAIPGSYGVAVLNTTGAPMPYTLRVVTTSGTGGGNPVAPAPGGGILAVNAAVDPVDDQAVVNFTLERGGPVTLRIYDVTGRMVHQLQQNDPAGSYAIRWDGRLQDGRRAPSGIYFYRVTMPGGKDVVRKTAILR